MALSQLLKDTAETRKLLSYAGSYLHPFKTFRLRKQSPVHLASCEPAEWEEQQHKAGCWFQHQVMGLALQEPVGRDGVPDHGMGHLLP